MVDNGEMKPADFGKELKRLREKAKISQQALAQRMGNQYSNSISAYETERQSPTLKQAERVVHALGYRLELKIVKRS